MNEWNIRAPRRTQMSKASGTRSQSFPSRFLNAARGRSIRTLLESSGAFVWQSLSAANRIPVSITGIYSPRVNQFNYGLMPLACRVHDAPRFISSGGQGRLFSPVNRGFRIGVRFVKMTRIAAILPAAGLGTRMGADTHKQFLELDGIALVVFML